MRDRVMVSIKNLNDVFQRMIEKHKSGEGASYDEARADIDAFNSQLEEAKEKMGEIKITLSKYKQKSEEINRDLDRIWKRATGAQTCKLKLNEIRSSLEEKNTEARNYVSQYVQRIGLSSNLGSIVGDLSQLVEKLEEEPHIELKGQIEDVDTRLKFFLKIKANCSEEKLTSALEQIIFLKGLETPINPEKLVDYVDGLTKYDAKTALDELTEKKCGINVEYIFDLKVLEKN